MRKRKVSGKCALCGKEGPLSFEHIPPEKAFNSFRARPVTGNLIMEDPDRMPWDTEGLPYESQQRGMGKYSLCTDCNNNTGSWYADEYITFARTFAAMFTDENLESAEVVGVKDVYPLRIMKQIVSMFCSINNFEDERIKPLREFVLNKTAVGLDKDKYKICMYMTNSPYQKYAPLSVLIRQSGNQLETMAISEITFAPLGFVLYFNPTASWKYDGIDITDMADCGYDECCTIKMRKCIMEMNDLFPPFYRTKAEILKCVEQNSSIEDSE